MSLCKHMPKLQVILQNSIREKCRENFHTRTDYGAFHKYQSRALNPSILHCLYSMIFFSRRLEINEVRHRNTDPWNLRRNDVRIKKFVGRVAVSFIGRIFEYRMRDGICVHNWCQARYVIYHRYCGTCRALVLTRRVGKLIDDHTRIYESYSVNWWSDFRRAGHGLDPMIHTRVGLESGPEGILRHFISLVLSAMKFAVQVTAVFRQRFWLCCIVTSITNAIIIA